VDPVTPLCTQLTYEGFIDEAIGIVNGAVDVTNGRRRHSESPAQL